MTLNELYTQMKENEKFLKPNATVEFAGMEPQHQKLIYPDINIYGGTLDNTFARIVLKSAKRAKPTLFSNFMKICEDQLEMHKDWEIVARYDGDDYAIGSWFVVNYDKQRILLCPFELNIEND